MCGIFTYFGVRPLKIDRAIEVINHRGPDSKGFLVFNASENFRPEKNYLASNGIGKKVVFGFARLAIIDLQNHSNQPLSLQSNHYHIVFNGEIYNYKELKKELESFGYHFITDSDTEVLLTSYIHWGENCVSHFNGMWAFTILDLVKKQLFVSRDRFGVKPLYYYRDNNEISFFSEIKQIFSCGIAKEINENVIRDFLESAILDAGNETFYKNIYRFPASSSAVISIDSSDYKLEPYRYYDLSVSNSYEKITYPEACSEFVSLFKSSIDLRYRSDVPVGACLSGGLDSSSIVSMAAYLRKEVMAFTVDNKQKELSEIGYVNKVCQKYSNINLKVTYNSDQDLDLLDEVLKYQDEPISGLGVIAQWKVMKLAKENNVVVLLDGQGGDEIFGGYRKFVFFYLKQLTREGKFVKAAYEASKFFGQKEFNFFDLEGLKRYTNTSGVNNFLSTKSHSLERNFRIDFKSADGFEDKSYQDIFYFSYPQLLRYEDRNSMAFSLESRVPFLDYRLVSFIYNLPPSFKIRNGYTKALLRDGLNGILPDEVRLRKSKLGFATPEKVLITSDKNQYFLQYLNHMDNPYINGKLLTEDMLKKKPNLDYKSTLRLYLFDRWFQKAFNK
jgi:asparagine synthase (glutamine-hydrolysing)